MDGAVGEAGESKAKEVEVPRERLLQVGPGGMSDAELLSLLLGGGSRGTGAFATASALLRRFEGLGGLARAHVCDLRDESGVGVAKAALLASALELGRRSTGPRSDRPALRTPEEVDALYRPQLAHLPTEEFHVACLDLRHRLLRDARVASGGITACALHPREVFAPAVREGAVGLVLVHNHPSGDPSPSAEDVQLTARLQRAGEVLGIKVLDHVVIASDGFASLHQRGHLR
jgi:DNA repair protein RadC